MLGDSEIASLQVRVVRILEVFQLSDLIGKVFKCLIKITAYTEAVSWTLLAHILVGKVNLIITNIKAEDAVNALHMSRLQLTDKSHTDLKTPPRR
jgi:hypothetical protein